MDRYAPAPWVRWYCICSTCSLHQGLLISSSIPFSLTVLLRVFLTKLRLVFDWGQHQFTRGPFSIGQNVYPPDLGVGRTMTPGLLEILRLYLIERTIVPREQGRS